MTDFVISDAVLEQVDEIAAIEAQCFSVPWTKKQIISQLPDESHIFICAVKDGAVLGYVNAMLAADEAYISNVAVATQYRRLGVGDKLIEGLSAIGKKRELSFLTLEARAGNTPALSLYEKYGFVPVGRRKNYYEKPKEDAILMTLFLK